MVTNFCTTCNNFNSNNNRQQQQQPTIKNYINNGMDCRRNSPFTAFMRNLFFLHRKYLLCHTRSLIFRFSSKNLEDQEVCYVDALQKLQVYFSISAPLLQDGQKIRLINSMERPMIDDTFF